MKNRLGIFVIYDADGLVGGYREYLLRDMTENLSELVIVYNGHMCESELDKLHKYSSRVYVRENKGFDAGAIKNALCDYIGWDEIKKYDDLVIFNDSFYGPLYPFKVMFEEMDKRDVDFWGIYKHKNDKRFPEHIQSFFFCIGRKMASSTSFSFFWMNLDVNYSDITDAIFKYELVFTKHFEMCGFRWDVYVDSSKYGVSNPLTINHKLISECGSPIIKRKALIGSDEFSTERAIASLNQIRNHANYNVDLILEDLLRRHSIIELIHALDLYYVLPTNVSESQFVNTEKIAIVINLECTELIDGFTSDFIRNVLNIPKFIDVYISVADNVIASELAEKIPFDMRGNITVATYQNNSNAVSPFSDTFCLRLKQYNLVCYINELYDKKNALRRITESFCAWHNMLASNEYINNVIETFNKNSRLGILAGPLPCCRDYLRLLKKCGNRAVYASQLIKEKLGLRVILSYIERFDLNMNAFWFRPEAIKMVLEHEIPADIFPKDFFNANEPANIICPFIAQHEGYYTGVLMTTEYARLEIGNKSMCVSSLNNVLDKIITIDYGDIPNTIQSIDKFIKLNSPFVYNKVYVYGTGEVGERYYQRLAEHKIAIQGFIVSEGHKKTDFYHGLPVYELSDLLDVKDEIKIIIAVSLRLGEEIRENLADKGFKNVLN